MSQESIQQVFARAVEHHQARRFREAEALYRQILEHHPDHADSLHLLGVLAYQLHRHTQARALIAQAIALYPDVAIYHCNLGEVYRAQNHPDLAMQEYRRAIELDPQYPEPYSNLSIVLYDLHRFEESIQVCRKALELKPRFARAHNNLGISLHHSGAVEQAMAAYTTALECDPELADAHRNLALLLLLLGDYERGFQEYEWRIQCTEFTNPVRVYPKPFWDGADLEGKTLLLHTEQGFGDAIQFIRYLPLVAQRGGKIIIECQSSLVRLFEKVPGVERVLAYNSLLPEFDVQLPFMSLSRIFNTRAGNIPNQVPYLAVLPELAAQFEAKVAAAAPAGKMKIGLAWAGSPTHKDDRNRSVPLAALAPLFEIPHVSFFSLQKGPAAGQIATSGLPLMDLTADLGDFADTAALIAQLDLVISVDTAVAHLAGALAKPVWTLIPTTTDWRWMLQRLDTPWYPTMRLFRQPSQGNWPPAIAQVAAALQELLAEKG